MGKTAGHRITKNLPVHLLTVSSRFLLTAAEKEARLIPPLHRRMLNAAHSKRITGISLEIRCQSAHHFRYSTDKIGL